MSIKKGKLMKQHKVTSKSSILLFDIGNVLFNFNLDLALEKLVELKLFNCKNQALLFLKSMEAKINLGHTNMYDLIAFYDGGKRESLYREYVSFWNSTELFCPNIEIIKFINNNIKFAYNEKYNLPYYGIISNMGLDHYKFIMSYPDKEVNTFFNNMNIMNFSYETGYLKPKCDSFLYGITAVDYKKENIRDMIKTANKKVLYIDDKMENLIMAKKVWEVNDDNIFQFDAMKQKKEELFEVLVNFLHY